MNDYDNALDQLGVPSYLVRQEAQSAVRQEFGRITDHMQRLGTAAAALEMQFGDDYRRLAPQIGQELANNPQLANFAQSDPAGALNAAFHALRGQQPRSATGQFQARPPGHGGPAPPNPRSVYAGDWIGTPEQEIQRGFVLNENTGRMRPRDEAAAERYAHARLREAISDDFLNS